MNAGKMKRGGVSGNRRWIISVWVLLLPLVASGCLTSFGEWPDTNVDADTEGDGDADADIDGDADVDGDADGDGDSDCGVDSDLDMDDEDDAETAGDADIDESVPECGNGVLEDGEECDDGDNGDPCDGCLDGCITWVNDCGDALTCGEEECDDGNTSDEDSCHNSCVVARCGDGFTWTGEEECDDGNDIETDSCTSSCRNARCDDGFVQDGVEECDGDGARECETACEAIGTQACVACSWAEDCVPPEDECDDGLACTEDLCDEDSGSCVNRLTDGHCLINDACFDERDINPSNACTECRSETSNNGWTHVCLHRTTETSYDDFSSGSCPPPLGVLYDSIGRCASPDIYVSRDGSVRVIRAGDLNTDGWHDLVFSNSNDAVSHFVNSYVYYGSETRFEDAIRTELPSIGSSTNVVADLDADSYMDIVLTNYVYRDEDGVLHYPEMQFIYWGSDEGFSEERRSEVSNSEPYDVAVADLDSNGFLDIVFSRATRRFRIHYGSDEGFAETETVVFSDSTNYLGGISIADVNKDSYLDLIFSVSWSGSSSHADSIVILGSGSGFSDEPDVLFPTIGSRFGSVADIDENGYLDIVFSNRNDSDDGMLFARYSYLYFGSDAGFRDPFGLSTSSASGNRISHLNDDGLLDIIFCNTNDDSAIYWGLLGDGDEISDSLSGSSARDCYVADLDLDGYQDIAFAGTGDVSEDRMTSYIYWGPDFDPIDRVELETIYAHGLPDALGNTYDRSGDYLYESSPIDIGEDHSLTRIVWNATLPLEDCTVRFRLRTADTRAGLSGATWYGPTSEEDWYEAPWSQINSVHAGHRHVQYLAMISSPTFRAAPSLDSVTLWAE